LGAGRLMSRIWLPPDSDIALAARGWPGPGVKPTERLVPNYEAGLIQKFGSFYAIQWQHGDVVPPDVTGTYGRIIRNLSGSGENITQYFEAEPSGANLVFGPDWFESFASATPNCGARMYSGPHEYLENGFPYSFFLDVVLPTSGNVGVTYADIDKTNQSLGCSTTSGAVRIFAYSAASGFTYAESSETLPPGERARILCVATDSNVANWRLYANGKKLSNSRSGTTTVPNIATDRGRFSIGSLTRSNYLSYSGKYYSAGASDYAFTDAEAIAITADPYGVLTRSANDAPYLITVPDAGGGAYDETATLTATPAIAAAETYAAPAYNETQVDLTKPPR